jgi:hypothetical protein
MKICFVKDRLTFIAKEFLLLEKVYFQLLAKKNCHGIIFLLPTDLNEIQKL